jgi:ribosomal protein S18 acetylase RimI-like enzyme
MGDLQIRRLEPREWAGIFPLIVQLRPHLDEAEFLRRALRQTQNGYEIVGAFREGRIVGVLGMRPVHTLTRGFHLHIDDIVVDENVRKSGCGRALMDYAEADARSRGMASVFLDARPEAIGFYETLGLTLHTAPSMRKML